MVAIGTTAGDAIAFTCEVTLSTASTTIGTSDYIQCPTLSFCEWASWFQDKQDLLDYQNELRIDGYRKDLFNSSQKNNHGLHSVQNQFKNYDKRLKMERNWRGKELTR